MKQFSPAAEVLEDRTLLDAGMLYVDADVLSSGSGDNWTDAYTDLQLALAASATLNAAGGSSGGGGICNFGSSSTATLNNTIVAENDALSWSDIYISRGTLSGSHNLIGDGIAIVDIGAFEGVNQPPTAVDDAVSTNEDTVLNGDVLAANPTTADSNPDGDTLTVIKVNGSTGMSAARLRSPRARC